MFICHKCGYKDYSDKEKTHCPICGENIIVPKAALILFLSMVSYIIFTILSMFKDKLSIISAIFLVVVVISLPFAIIEAFERKDRIKDGFRAPDYPDEIIDGDPRIPDFKSYDYVYGIDEDEGVKKILLEPYKDGLNYYYNKLAETQKIDYDDIVGLELHEENELKMSAAKSVVYGALLGAAGGIGAGMAGGALGGFESKNRYVLEIQFKKNDRENSLYISSGKNELICLAKDIENKANGEQQI